MIAAILLGVLATSAGAVEPTAEQLRVFERMLDQKIEEAKQRLDEAERIVEEKKTTTLLVPSEPTDDRPAKSATKSTAKMSRAEKAAAAKAKKAEKAKKSANKETGLDRAKRAKLERIEMAQDRVVADRAALSSLEAGQMPTADTLFRYGAPNSFAPLKVGDFGAINKWPSKILQILNEKEMLLSVGGHFRSGVDFPHAIVLLRIPTEGLADDSPIMLGDNRLFVVTGTHKYETVSGGPKTVMAVEEVDIDAIRKHLVDRAAKNKQVAE